MLDSLVEELIALPTAAREPIVARLVANAGHSCRDFAFEPSMRAHNARAELAAALVSRLAREAVLRPD